MSTGITPARRAAYEVLRRTFEDDAWANRAFASAAARHELSGRELARARRLSYGAVQRRGTLDHVLAGLARRPPDAVDAPVLAALRLGLFELCFSARPDSHAVVDQAVELAKAGVRRDGRPAGRARAAASFANAVMRRAAEDPQGLLAGLGDEHPAAAAIAHSYPRWLAEMWWRELGAADARSLMAAMNEPAETAFRVNTLRTSPAALFEQLARAGVEARRAEDGPLAAPEALVVARAEEPVRTRVLTGELVPQSRGSLAVVELLGPRPGERVLDLCAGPGIKTTAIAARMEGRGEVLSVELVERRAREIEELCGRTGARSVRVRVADAAEADLGSGYDRILVDPPCSDLGTLASRPDARWRKSPEQIERLAALQRRILVRAARGLRTGGTLVLSTCTLSARENEDLAGALERFAPGLVADELGAAHPGLASRRDRRFLQIRPDRDGTTGFFIARFRRAR